MSLQLNFKLPDKLYLKDPQDSKYGKRLLSNAIELIDELGFESFTFKKLGIKMESTEVSIYRYFENKHLLLLYLNCWYCEWVTYLIEMKTLNVVDSEEKLKRAIRCMIYANIESELTDYIDENKLFHIIMKESSKTYHISQVDKENKFGLFLPYKGLVGKVADIMEEVNPNFKYAKSLASALFEMINNQIFYTEHLPRLTILSCQTADNTASIHNVQNTATISYSGLDATQHKNLKPFEALGYLKSGNNQFVNEEKTSRSHNIDQRVSSVKQYPFATILSCFDSRIPVEDIFNKGIGDLLVLRVAGNVVNTDILGSMEYGATDLGSKIIVVLGHKNCTSVEKAIDSNLTGNVASISHKIKGAMTKANQVFGPKSTKNAEYYHEVVKANVLNSMDAIRSDSPILNQLITKGEVSLVGAIYDMKTGKVEYL